MTATKPTLSGLSDVLREAYGIEPATLVRLGDGYQNEVWRARAEVIRIERAGPESVGWEHRLVRFFAARLDEVPAPRAVADGSTFVEHEGLIVSVWPYVDGTPMRRRHEPHLVAAAELLARLHAVGVDWPGGQRPGASAQPGSGVRGPIHGDFCRGNILVRRGRIVALVDWEESWVDLLEYELANAVWQLCCSKREHDFDRHLAHSMLEAYGSDLDPDDLVPLILARLRYERDVWSAESDEPYRTHLRRSIARLGG